MTNELTLVVEQTGLEPAKTDILLSKFGVFYEKAKEIAKSSQSIIVTEESQTEEMANARTARLALKEIRVEAEKVRKGLKEQSLRESRAIDGVYNLIAALIVPVEKHLEQQEKFAEVREAERQAKKHADRIEKLSKFVDDVSLYNLKEMTDEAFDKLLENSKTAYEAQKAAEAKAEEERIAKQEAELKEQARIKEENERLKEEAQKKEKEFAAERAARKLEIENEQKAKVEAENKLKAERDLQERKELEAKQSIEHQKRLEEEAQRKALLAPDKEKLMDLVGLLQEMKLPAVQSKQANDVLGEFDRRMTTLEDWLYEEAKKL